MDVRLVYLSFASMQCNEPMVVLVKLIQHNAGDFVLFSLIFKFWRQKKGGEKGEKKVYPSLARR